jgi:Protein of unknown function (DUF4232)
MVGSDRTTSRRLTPVGLAALGLVLVLAGCGSGSIRPSAAATTSASASATATRDGTVPWVDEPASPPPPPLVPGARAKARACGVADLSATAQNQGANGGMGHQDIRMTVANVGRSRCSLIGTPDLVDQGTNGQVTVIPSVAGPILGYAGIVGYATINPGESAWLIIEESLSCNGGGDQDSYTNVAISIPGATVSMPGTTLTTTCPIRVSTWYLKADADYRAPNRFAMVNVTITAPESVRRGGALVYTVTLTNYQPLLSLTPCPVYTETLGSEAHTYRLNCGASVLAYGDNRFEMRMAVPANLAAGPIDLDWKFDEPGVADNAGNGTTLNLL